MLGRGFVEVRLAFAGGSEFTKTRRPSSSTTEAMCPLVFCANNGAKNDAATIAQRASVALRNHPQFVARLFIHHASAVRHTLYSSSIHTAAIILECLVAVNATSVLCALDLPFGMPLSRWKLGPAPLEIGRPKHPGNAISAPSHGFSGMNLPIGVVSWNPRATLAHNGTTRPESIITTPPPGTGRSARPFLGQLCLFRQLRLGQVFRRPNPLP